jgi:type I restriction enzyme R subunit
LFGPWRHNRAIATQEVIEELIKLARELDAATKRGEDLGLNEDEIAYYDALAANESACARIRVMVKRILKKYGYPPDLQDEAIKTVLEQAALMSTVSAVA